MNLDILNEQQKQAVMHTDGPLLLLAGAGSGKTRVLTHRAAYLVGETGVMPYHILAITFTNKAAGEMRERIDKIVGSRAGEIWVATFHATCVRILRRYIDRLGFDTNFTIYDADDQKALMKDICKRMNIDTKIHKERTFLSVISSAKDQLLDPVAFRLSAAGDFVKERQADVYREYQAALKKNNALDFDDLIVKTVELFRNNKEVLNNYQERFRYIMVDEYQDTNTAQFELIHLLAGKYHNLCVVGDDDQSIYKFRGANIHNILNFEKVFPDARVIKLEQNYRSTQTILDAANGVISRNHGRKEKSLWTENEKGEAIPFLQFENGYEEADYVCGDVERRVNKGEFTFKDCAVLYRTNAQSRLFEERFVAANIPYKIVGGVNFYARKEIKDLLAYLKTIDNARDDLAVRRIINIPKRGIGATTITRVQSFADNEDISFYEALKRAKEVPSIGKAATKIESFVLFIQALRSKLELISLADLMEEILESTGYLKELELEQTPEAQARIENIDELISKITAYDQENEHPTLNGFLEEVALVADIDTVEEDSNYVLLMTLHSAKGLEFPNVYLAGLEDGLFPGYMSITSDDPTEVEEERRLMYVGITRAMKRLTISSARMRMVRGETRFNMVSRFVKEIPGKLLSSGQKEAGQELSEKKTEDLPFLSFQEEKRKDSLSENPYRKAKEAFRSKPYLQTNTSPQNSAGRFGAEKNFSTSFTKSTTLPYGEGDRVRHTKFGEGTVLKVVEGGRDYEVSVEFDKFGVKKMFASFAKLKKV